MGTLQIMLIYIVIMLILFAPQIISNRKKKQRQQAMMDSLKVGDTIVTFGGIHGSVSEVLTETVEVKIDKNARMTISKTAIAKVVK